MQAVCQYPVGKYMIRCLQIDFHLVSEYCQITALVTGLFNNWCGAAHEIYAVCSTNFS